MQEENILEDDSKNEKEFYTEKIVEQQSKKRKLNYYYEESINALIQYMKEHDVNPSEKCWNHYAIQKKYLSSKTIGYLSGIGFNTLCRKTRKQINKEKIK